MKLILDASNEQIREFLDTTEGNARVIQTRAVKKLRDSLKVALAEPIN